MDFIDTLKIYSEEILNNCIALSSLAGSLQCKLFGALFPPPSPPPRACSQASGVRGVRRVTFLCVENWPITMCVITRTSWLVYIAYCDWWNSCIGRLSEQHEILSKVAGEEVGVLRRENPSCFAKLGRNSDISLVLPVSKLPAIWFIVGLLKFLSKVKRIHKQTYPRSKAIQSREVLLVELWFCRYENWEKLEGLIWCCSW